MAAGTFRFQFPMLGNQISLHKKLLDFNGLHGFSDGGAECQKQDKNGSHQYK
jgi:hypothetical protein